MKNKKLMGTIALIIMIAIASSGCTGKNTTKVNNTEKYTIIESEPFALAKSGWEPHTGAPTRFLHIEMLGHDDVSDITAFRSNFALLKITDSNDGIVTTLFQKNMERNEAVEVSFEKQKIKITLNRINAAYQSNQKKQNYIRKITADITVDYSNIEGN
jgi:hypothetical protein